MKLATNKTRRNYLVKEPNYHTANFFSESLLATEIKKTWILTNKPVYYIRNMYEFWYNLRETKIWQKNPKKTTKLCYMETHSDIIYLKTGERHLFRHFKRC